MADAFFCELVSSWNNLTKFYCKIFENTTWTCFNWFEIETGEGKSIIIIKSVVNFGGIEVASFFLGALLYTSSLLYIHMSFFFTISSLMYLKLKCSLRQSRFIMAFHLLWNTHNFHFFFFLFVRSLGAYWRVLRNTKMWKCFFFNLAVGVGTLKGAFVCCAFADFSTKNNYSYYENASRRCIILPFWHFFYLFFPLYIFS